MLWYCEAPKILGFFYVNSSSFRISTFLPIRILNCVTASHQTKINDDNDDEILMVVMVS